MVEQGCHKTAIKLHNPGTVDLAYSLAQMQEVLLAEDSRPYYKKPDYKSKWKPQMVPTSILGAPPKDTAIEDRPRHTDKVDSLRAQHHARGECFKCGEKFSPGHKCPKTVQLHVMEELLEALQISETNEAEHDDSNSASEADSDTWHCPQAPPTAAATPDALLKLSVHAATGTTSRQSFKLHGLIGKHELLILIDSGSSSNFISEDLVERIQCPTQQIPTAKVTVAGSGTLPCNAQVPDLRWWCQGHSSTSTLKVLPLGSYGIILGMDWLEAIDKMWVSWVNKTMRFKHNGTRITL